MYLALPTMESFSLLKYWKASGIVTTGSRSVSSTASTTTTIATSISSPDSNTDQESAAVAVAEDGSFFDLEFASIPNEEGESVSESEEDKKQSNADTDTDTDPKSELHHAPASLLKSAARFRVFAMGLKKPKSDPNAADSPKSGGNGGNFFVEVFTGSRNSKPAKPDDAASDQDEKKFNVQRYISKIKPLYIRVSRRYGERTWFSGPLTAEEGGERTAGVLKQMVKSRSAVASVTSPPAVVQRRDDSLLQQEDGIQSAIAHCKMSFNSCGSKETKASAVTEAEETK